MKRIIPNYPKPNRSDFNAPMLDAWAKGELVLQQCQSCDYKVYFPRSLCPHCWSLDLAWVPLTGKGTIVSFTTVHKHVHESFADESPTILAQILLDEGWSMLARVVTSDMTAVHSGSLVSLVPCPDAARFPLPTFCLRT